MADIDASKSHARFCLVLDSPRNIPLRMYFTLINLILMKSGIDHRILMKVKG